MLETDCDAVVGSEMFVAVFLCTTVLVALRRLGLVRLLFEKLETLATVRRVS